MTTTVRPEVPLSLTRVEVEGTYAGVSWVNLFWLEPETTGTPGTVDMNGLAEDFFNAYVDWTQAQRSEECTVDQAIATWYDGSGGVVVGSYANSTAGSDIGNPLTGQVAMVVSWRIARSYRGGHPRTYLAGFTFNKLASAQTWSTDVLAAMQTATDGFLAAVDGLTLGTLGHVSLGCLSWYVGGSSELVPKQYRDTPVFFPIGSAVVKPGVATQRRRLGANSN